MIDSLKKIVPNRMKQQIGLAIHSGNRYICPFCGYRSKDLTLLGNDFKVLSEMQVVGAGIRYGGCRKCNSTDRERLIYIYLKEYLEVFNVNNRFKILHLAPEKRLTKEILQLNIHEYICGDLFSGGYNYDSHVQNMDVLAIPYDDNYFDIIICNHLLEHVPSDMDAMQELYRVLGPRGKAILQVPISKNTFKTYEDFSITKPVERETAFGQFDHVRIYGQDYPDKLSAVGFKVERVNISKAFVELGLNEEEDIFVAAK